MMDKHDASRHVDRYRIALEDVIVYGGCLERVLSEKKVVHAPDFAFVSYDEGTQAEYDADGIIFSLKEGTVTAPGFSVTTFRPNEATIDINADIAGVIEAYKKHRENLIELGKYTSEMAWHVIQVREEEDTRKLIEQRKKDVIELAAILEELDLVLLKNNGGTFSNIPDGWTAYQVATGITHLGKVKSIAPSKVRYGHFGKQPWYFASKEKL